jgi:hypothetical protein
MGRLSIIHTFYSRPRGLQAPGALYLLNTEIGTSTKLLDKTVALIGHTILDLGPLLSFFPPEGLMMTRGTKLWSLVKIHSLVRSRARWPNTYLWLSFHAGRDLIQGFLMPFCQAVRPRNPANVLARSDVVVSVSNTKKFSEEHLGFKNSWLYRTTLLLGYFACFIIISSRSRRILLFRPLLAPSGSHTFPLGRSAAPSIIMIPLWHSSLKPAASARLMEAGYIENLYGSLFNPVDLTVAAPPSMGC